MRKYGESKTTRIMMANVTHVTSGLGLRKFQADGFLLTRVYVAVLQLKLSSGTVAFVSVVLSVGPTVSPLSTAAECRVASVVDTFGILKCSLLASGHCMKTEHWCVVAALWRVNLYSRACCVQ